MLYNYNQESFIVMRFGVNHLLQYFGRFLLNLAIMNQWTVPLKWNGMVECNTGMHFVCFIVIVVVIVFYVVLGFKKNRKKLFVCWEVIRWLALYFKSYLEITRADKQSVRAQDGCP